MAYVTLIVEISDHTCLIRLNRPDALNALNLAMMQELADALTAADRNDKIRCIVLTGSQKAFAAGADVREMAAKSFTDVFGADIFARETDAIQRVRKPIIAAVNGYALGGGCELAMSCDFIIAGDSAKFGQPEIKIGTIPGAGGTQRLTRAIGKSKAMLAVLTGEPMDAYEAEKAGLVAKIVPAETLLQETFEIAKVISNRAPVAVKLAKEAVNMAFESSLKDGMEYERRNFYLTFSSKDQK